MPEMLLVLTFLAHPNIGTEMLKAKRSELEKRFISLWGESFLSFVEPI